jgi:hypothetical protein
MSLVVAEIHNIIAGNLHMHCRRTGVSYEISFDHYFVFACGALHWFLVLKGDMAKQVRG